MGMQTKIIQVSKNQIQIRRSLLKKVIGILLFGGLLGFILVRLAYVRFFTGESKEDIFGGPGGIMITLVFLFIIFLLIVALRIALKKINETIDLRGCEIFQNNKLLCEVTAIKEIVIRSQMNLASRYSDYYSVSLHTEQLILTNAEKESYTIAFKLAEYLEFMLNVPTRVYEYG